jgi:hypothetical protein
MSGGLLDTNDPFFLDCTRPHPLLVSWQRPWPKKLGIRESPGGRGGKTSSLIKVYCPIPFEESSPRKLKGISEAGTRVLVCDTVWIQ